jgi:hypothetical protein
MRRRIFTLAVAAFLLSSVAALNTLGVSGRTRGVGKRISGAPSRQLFICEREYINFAFGRVRRGIYVDGAGGVYSYAYRRADKAWLPSKDGTYTEAELLEKYDHDRKLIATLKPKEIAAKRRLILKASRGTYSERIIRGADQGTYKSACYLYDAATARYRELTLRVTGDARYENLSEEAKTLSAWLDSLAARMSAGVPR